MVTNKAFKPPEDYKYRQFQNKQLSNYHPYAGLGFRPRINIEKQSVSYIQQMINTKLQNIGSAQLKEKELTIQDLQTQQQYMNNCDKQFVRFADYPPVYQPKISGADTYVRYSQVVDRNQLANPEPSFVTVKPQQNSSKLTLKQLFSSQKLVDSSQDNLSHLENLLHQNKYSYCSPDRYQKPIQEAMVGMKNIQMDAITQQKTSYQCYQQKEYISKLLRPTMTQQTISPNEIASIQSDTKASYSVQSLSENKYIQNARISKNYTDILVQQSQFESQVVVQNKSVDNHDKYSQQSNIIQVPTDYSLLLNYGNIRDSQQQRDSFSRYLKLATYIGLQKLKHSAFLLVYDQNSEQSYQTMAEFFEIEVLHQDVSEIQTVKKRFINFHSQFDLHSILPGNMMDDALFDFIGFYLMKVNMQYKFISCRSFDLDSIMQFEMQDYNYKDRIYTGFIENQHWYGLFVDFEREIVMYFDGLNACSEIQAKKQLNRMFHSFEKFKVEQLVLPSQHNYVDCGFYLIMAFIAIISNQSVDFSSDDIISLRYNILKLLLCEAHVVK